MGAGRQRGPLRRARRLHGGAEPGAVPVGGHLIILIVVVSCHARTSRRWAGPDSRRLQCIDEVFLSVQQQDSQDQRTVTTAIVTTTYFNAFIIIIIGND